MKIKSKLILKSIIFFTISIIILFFGIYVGETDDAPLASLIGIVLSIIFIYFGIKNIIIIKKKA